MMKVYALRERETDKYMPAHKPSKLSRGYSWDEPTDRLPYGPRLFPSIESARSALFAWKRGPWSKAPISYDWEGYTVFSEPRPIGGVVAENRRRRTMMIVEFHLAEIASFT